MPKNKQQEAQEKRLQKNIRQAKKTRADAKQGKTKSARSKPSKKGGFFAGLKADAPQTVQQSIPYREMYRDGICRLTDTLYTKTVQFFDINYQLAQADDKAQIFEGYCDFLNYFDASIHVQLTFINQRANMQDFKIILPNINAKYETENATVKTKSGTPVTVHTEKKLSDEEEKILEYARKHGAITRNDVIGLLEVSASTAARVIRKMVKTNLLEQKGKARNTHYTIAE